VKTFAPAHRDRPDTPRRRHQSVAGIRKMAIIDAKTAHKHPSSNDVLPARMPCAGHIRRAYGPRFGRRQRPWSSSRFRSAASTPENPISDERRKNSGLFAFSQVFLKSVKKPAMADGSACLISQSEIPIIRQRPDRSAGAQHDTTASAVRRG